MISVGKEWQFYHIHVYDIWMAENPGISTGIFFSCFIQHFLPADIKLINIEWKHAIQYRI